MALITGYPDGSDITIMNATYVKPRKEEYESSNGEIRTKRGEDYMWIVYKDNEKDIKHCQIIKYPKYTYYVAKHGTEKPYNQFFTSVYDVDQKTCRFRDLNKELYKELGREQEYKNNISSGNYKANSLIHADPRIFCTDMNIEDHYRAKFAEAYKNSIGPIHKGFFDIEADTIDMAGDFPEYGECKINCVSYYNEQNNTVYTFILRDAANPLIESFEKECRGKDLYDELYNFIIDAVGGLDAANEFGVGGVKQQFRFFDNEISMLKNIFNTIHELSPDFVLAWNMAFDIPYIIQRIINIGYNPEDIMTDNRLDDCIKEVFYYIDQRHYNELAERTDFARISGLPVWLDQMLQFAQKRKAKIGSFTSFKLDDIGNDTVGVRKLDYSHITTDIAKFPYLDFKLFVFYNIMDVVVQKCIEARCKDVDYIFTNCLVNNTSYRKGYRQTVYLANRIIKDFKEKGYIGGNNVNRIKAQMPGAKKPEKYAGAIVTDTTLTGEQPRRSLFGTKAMVADNVIDEDYKALYPSGELENNIAPNTQIGKINMWNKWEAEYYPDKDHVFRVWIMDLENAHEWPTYPTDSKDEKDDGKKKRYKPVYLYQDPNYTIPVDGFQVVEYHPEQFRTLYYERVYDGQNFNMDEKYEAAGEFTENYMCQNSIIFASRYLYYATFRQFVEEDLPEFISSKKYNSLRIHRMTDPIIHVESLTELEQLSNTHKPGEKYNPIIVYDEPGGKKFSDYISELESKL